MRSDERRIHSYNFTGVTPPEDQKGPIERTKAAVRYYFGAIFSGIGSFLKGCVSFFGGSWSPLWDRKGLQEFCESCTGPVHVMHINDDAKV